MSKSKDDKSVGAIALILMKKRLVISYDGSRVSLGSKAKADIEKHWRHLLAVRKDLVRGDVFNISEVNEDEFSLNVKLCLTDYAHYMAARHGALSPPDDRLRVIHSSVLIKTKDGFMAIGKMAGNTSTPGRLQLAGGGITRDDLKGDGTIDMEGNARMELSEETGLGDGYGYDCGLRLKYLKSGGKYDSMAAVYVAEVSLSKDEVYAIFNRHNEALKARGEFVELEDLLFIKNSAAEVGSFIEENEGAMEDLVPPLLVREAMEEGKKQ